MRAERQGPDFTEDINEIELVINTEFITPVERFIMEKCTSYSVSTGWTINNGIEWSIGVGIR